MKKFYSKRKQKSKRILKKDFIDGKLSLSRSGSGFVPQENSLNEDVLIPPNFTLNAFHDDLVRVELDFKKSSKRLRGKIIKVISRANKTFTGRASKVNNKWLLNLDGLNIKKKIVIVGKKLSLLDEGDVVKTLILDWGDKVKPIIVKVDKLLSKSKSKNSDLQLIIGKYDISTERSKGIYSELNKFSQVDIKNELKKRDDNRSLIAITIDPSDAKDFDDALSIVKNGNAFELGIHIADVSYFVKEKSILDHDAMNRSTSYYFSEQTIHMLPTELSSGLCSLQPDVDRLSLSLFLTIDKSYKIIKSKFENTIIRSKKRFTYEEVDSILKEKKSSKYYDTLLNLKKISIKWRNDRFSLAGFNLDIPEVTFEIDKKGFPFKIEKSENTVSHQIVEEFMLVANKYAASKILKSNSQEKLFRNHLFPTDENVERIINMAKTCGSKIIINKENFSSKKLNECLNALTDVNKKSTFENVLLRSMKKATYGFKNEGHFGLGFDIYTHFTSPIRRYSDLIIHRIIKKIIFQKHTINVDINKNIIENINSSELKSLSSGREYSKIKLLRWMSRNINKSFLGIISGIIKNGIFVRIEETYSEGFISVDDLPRDIYYYNQEQFFLKGKIKENIFRLGENINIEIIKIDINKREATFKFLGR